MRDPKEPTTKPAKPKGDDSEALVEIFQQMEEIEQKRLQNPKAGIAAHLHPWSMDDPVPKSHAFQIGAGGDGLFPRGSFSVVASPGGMMKTAVAISLMQHCAAGQLWAGLQVIESCCLLLALEDDKNETTRRLIATAKAQIEPSKHDVLTKRIKVAALSGVDARLTAKLGGASGCTLVGPQIIQIANAAADECGLPVGLIVVDHSRLAIGGDANDSSDVTELTRVLAHIANRTGAAVVLLCHSPKSTINPKHPGEYSAADVLGSGAFVDNARFACVITTLTEKERKDYAVSEDAAKRHVALRVIKSNYSETGRTFFIRKAPVDGWGVIVPDVVTLEKPVKPTAHTSTKSEVVINFIKSRPGQLTKTAFKTWAGADGPLRLV